MEITPAGTLSQQKPQHLFCWCANKRATKRVNKNVVELTSTPGWANVNTHVAACKSCKFREFVFSWIIDISSSNSIKFRLRVSPFSSNLIEFLQQCDAFFPLSGGTRSSRGYFKRMLNCSRRFSFLPNSTRRTTVSQGVQLLISD